MTDDSTYQPRLKIIWLVWTLAAFVLFVAIAGYSRRMARDYPDDFDQQRAEARYTTLAQVRHDENALLTGTAWIDQGKGTVRIPIEEAMTREIETLKAQPAAIGAEIPRAAPAPAAPATNATNATPANPTPATKPTPSNK